MAKYQRRSQKESIPRAAGDGIGSNININGSALAFNAIPYPVLVDGLPMQPAAACQQRHKSLSTIPQKSSGRATTSRQQRMQQQQQQKQLQQQLNPPQADQAPQQSQPQAPIPTLQQQQQQQLQQLQLQQLRQLRHLYACWPNFGGMPNNMGIYNGLAAVQNPSPQLHNYGFSNNGDFWPGYTMITPTDPSRPYAFGLGAGD